MAAAGMDILVHSSRLALMGFSEVIKHLPFLLRVMKKAVSFIEERTPHRIILIDYPGFNLRLTKKVFSSRIPVTYFILPQVWAWKEKRVEILKRYTDQCLSIMPFEKIWFKERGLEVDFVGHPFVEDLSETNAVESSFEKMRLLLLPGSRQQEVTRHWPVYLEAAKELKIAFPELNVSVGKAAGVKLDPLPGWIKVESGNISEKMKTYTAAVTASGTATLEAAISNLPQVVCYRLSLFSWGIARLLVKVPFVSIVNVIAGRKVVPEFLQHEMTAKNINAAITPLLSDTDARRAMILEYRSVQNELGKPGVYERAASLILDKLPS